MLASKHIGSMINTENFPSYCDCTRSQGIYVNSSERSTWVKVDQLRKAEISRISLANDIPAFDM